MFFFREGVEKLKGLIIDDCVVFEVYELWIILVILILVIVRR